MHVPRWKKIADSIHADITQGKLQSGDALPSETDLAAQWQVSRVTAHRAMHELHQQGLVVRRRRYGTVVAGPERRRTGHVAVFFHGTRDFLEQEYLSGIRTGLPDEYDLMICAIRNDPQREAHYLERMSKTTDGILCMPTCAPQNTALLKSALQAGTNLVCVDCLPDDLSVDAVISGNFEATREAMHFLVQQGHSRVAHFTLDLFALSSVRERLAGYRQVMLETGHSDVQPWVRAFPLEVTREVERLRPVVQDALFTLLHQPAAPTAVLCVNDYMLCATIQACRELGLSLPDDLEIVSYNDCPPFVPFAPSNIHRIVQRAYEMGQIAAERLCRRMRGEVVAPEVVRIPCLFYAAETPDGPSLTQP